ncbi:MAG TPA: hypothetical protein VK763_08085 [Terriglobales bacterium]|jgi:hypothetical protein|nr:hypothetical protein [Terriglobales bacterium]
MTMLAWQKIRAEKVDIGRYTAIKTQGKEKKETARRFTLMAKVFTIPGPPPKLGPSRRRERTSDPRYVDGQRLLVEAMKYLTQSDPVTNRAAIALLSEHVRTRFRMTDSPLG